MRYFLLLFAIILLLLSATSNSLTSSIGEKKGKASEECEKKVHVSYNQKFKQSICEHAHIYGNGPAECVTLAKEKLHFKPEEAASLCKEAYSAAPVLCLLEVPMQQRKQFGVKLCANAEYKLPGECIAELLETKMKNKIGSSVQTDQIVEFCSKLGDTRAPIDCLSAGLQTKILTGKQALEVCVDSATSETDVVSRCFHEMKAYIGNGYKDSYLDIAGFCAQLTPEMFEKSDPLDWGPIFPHRNITEPVLLSNYSSIHCFLNSSLFSESSVNGKFTFSVKNRLDLCLNSPSNSIINPFNKSQAAYGEGPLICAKYLTTNKNSLSLNKLAVDDLVSLCKYASGIGPADCFLQAQQIADVQTKISLCMGALNSGPAACYSRAAPIFRHDLSKAIQLCIGSDSSAPGECAHKTPQTFEDEEKVALCSKSKGRGTESGDCFRAVESAAKVFIKNNIGSIKHLTEYIATNKYNFINFCSFPMSHNPLAAAECLKSAPTYLLLDEVINLCTNVSSADVLAHKILCTRILQSGWTQAETAELCELADSRLASEAIARCAGELSTAMKTMTFNGEKVVKENITSLCKHESENNKVSGCVKEALKFSKSSTSAPQVMTLSNLIDVCAGANSKGVASGQCLAGLVAKGGRLSYDSNLPRALCVMPNPLNKIVCLDNIGRREISIDDLRFCENEVRVPTYVNLIKLHTNLHGEPYAIAGKSFSIHVQILDQYKIAYNEEDKVAENIYVSINANNKQSAVLWGIRKNSTSTDGNVHFSSLIISQPGDLELKFYKLKTDFASSSLSDKVTLGLYALTVRSNPDVVDSQSCLEVFRRSNCGGSLIDVEADFPLIKSYMPAIDCLALVQLSNCSTVLTSWGVSQYFYPDGSCFIEYKSGIDSIWTGIGLPNVDSSYESRLDLSFILPTTSSITKKESKALQKETKKAYYRKSLLWHPDRWAGYPLYVPIVQGVFELIREAYDVATRRLVEAEIIPQAVKEREEAAAAKEAEPIVVPIYVPTEPSDRAALAPETP